MSFIEKSLAVTSDYSYNAQLIQKLSEFRPREFGDYEKITAVLLSILDPKCAAIRGLIVPQWLEEKKVALLNLAKTAQEEEAEAILIQEVAKRIDEIQQLSPRVKIKKDLELTWGKKVDEYLKAFPLDSFLHYNLLTQLLNNLLTFSVDVNRSYQESPLVFKPHWSSSATFYRTHEALLRLASNRTKNCYRVMTDPVQYGTFIPLLVQKLSKKLTEIDACSKEEIDAVENSSNKKIEEALKYFPFEYMEDFDLLAGFLNQILSTSLDPSFGCWKLPYKTPNFDKYNRAILGFNNSIDKLAQSIPFKTMGYPEGPDSRKGIYASFYINKISAKLDEIGRYTQEDKQRIIEPFALERAKADCITKTKHCLDCFPVLKVEDYEINIGIWASLLNPSTQVEISDSLKQYAVALKKLIDGEGLVDSCELNLKNRDMSQFKQLVIQRIREEINTISLLATSERQTRLELKLEKEADEAQKNANFKEFINFLTGSKLSKKEIENQTYFFDKLSRSMGWRPADTPIPYLRIGDPGNVENEEEEEQMAVEAHPDEIKEEVMKLTPSALRLLRGKEVIMKKQFLCRDHWDNYYQIKKGTYDQLIRALKDNNGDAREVLGLNENEYEQFQKAYEELQQLVNDYPCDMSNVKYYSCPDSITEVCETLYKLFVRPIPQKEVIKQPVIEETIHNVQTQAPTTEQTPTTQQNDQQISTVNDNNPTNDDDDDIYE